MNDKFKIILILNHYIICIMIGVAGISAFNGEKNFSQSPPPPPPSELKQANSAAFKGKERTESFVAKRSTSEEAARPVHMLWVIDNSESMSDDITAVNAGITSFAAGLRQHSGQVEVTMITKVGTGKVAISADILQGAGIHPVSLLVHSHYKIHNLAQYLKPSSFASYGFLKADDLKENLSHHPSSDFFLKPEALKVFVVVTDDKEQSASGRNASESFISMLSDSYGNLSSFRFFAFLDDVDHVRYASYSHLIQEMGGEKWDISRLSPAGWQGVLKIAQEKLISEFMQRVFTLKFTVKEVIEVKINGKTLDKSLYYVSQKKLHIKESYFKEKDKIDVVYLSN